MPYIKKEKRIKLTKDPLSIGDVGDLNYSYSLIYIALWVKNQSYKTIEFISEIGSIQEFPRFIKDIDRIAIRKGFSVKEITNAKFLAFVEFMRRVGNHYEDAKIEENGDIYNDVPFADTKEPQGTSLVPKAKLRGRKKNNG